MAKMTKCPKCYILTPMCICSEITPLETKMKLSLLLHYREAKKTTNSGRLAAMSLKNSKTYIIGLKDKPMDWPNLVSDEYENLLLFPTDFATVLTPELISQFKKPVNLIVPDGNWGQAARMVKRFRSITNKTYKFVILPAGEPSQYRLRIAKDKKYGISTMEAIARSYGFIESKSIEKELTSNFRKMVERNLFTRGRLKPDEVYGGIGNWPYRKKTP